MLKENSVDLYVDESQEGWDHSTGKFQCFAADATLLLCCEFSPLPTPGGDGQEKPCCMGGGNWSKEPRAQDCLTLQSFELRGKGECRFEYISARSWILRDATLTCKFLGRHSQNLHSSMEAFG